MSAADWAILICLTPLVIWGWWLKYDRQRAKRAKAARARRKLLDDLRKGKV